MGSVEHRWKRQSPSASSTAITGGGIKQELDREVEYVAQKMGVQTWHVVFFVVLLCLALIGLCAWCVIRFFRKKRTGKDKDADLAADEAALVDNEEEDLKVDEEALAAAKAASEYLGKLQYEIKYDFNTQTLVVKVSANLLMRNCVPNRESTVKQTNSIDVLFWSCAPKFFFRLLRRFQKVNKHQFGKAKKMSFSNPTWMP